MSSFTRVQEEESLVQGEEWVGVQEKRVAVLEEKEWVAEQEVIWVLEEQWAPVKRMITSRGRGVVQEEKG